jgi:hypothetical protein
MIVSQSLTYNDVTLELHTPFAMNNPRLNAFSEWLRKEILEILMLMHNGG